MTIYKSIRALNSKIPKSRGFLTSTSTTSYAVHSPFAPLITNSPFVSHCKNRFLLPKWIAPLQGPLFLSFPPWKLLQSATPLHLRGGGGSVLRKVEAFRLGLLGAEDAFRVGVGVVSVRREQKVVDRTVPEGFVESFLNLPNLISVSRMVSGPFLGWMIMNEWYSVAFAGLVISGATDWLDGYVARRMNINSVVGSYLDPLADKVLIASVALAMVYNDLLPVELVGLVLLRDIALVGGAAYKRASDLGWQWSSWIDFFDINGTRREKVEPLFISKVNTVFQLALVAVALLNAEFGTADTQSYIHYLSWLVASTTVASSTAYGVQYMRRSTRMLGNN
ncbi:hypothetical protein MLD38_039811 [Melastoma candidum]|uniref:Uncharacterized protein n=1 Tax=Melastoma candidum TaxID=119954 RepID=A0ACB9L4P4_9MYRT|nr:hypothetical protein MLD38_039811 [Melastoma candidum]